ENGRHHVPVPRGRLLALDSRLDLVVAGQQPLPLAGAEQPLELAAEAGVPVHQRAVAVERRPAILTHGNRAPEPAAMPARCVSINPATWPGSTSHGPWPPGSTCSEAAGIPSIEGLAASAERYGSSAPQMNVVGV